jgi:hypothetical protein
MPAPFPPPFIESSLFKGLTEEQNRPLYIDSLSIYSGGMRWNWDMIDVAAKALGVRAETRQKWKQRGAVPHRWRMPIYEYTNKKVDVFEDDAILLSRRRKKAAKDEDETEPELESVA